MNGAIAYLLPSGGRRFALRMLMPMVREGAATTWIHVAFEGAWEGHRDGPFEFTRETFEEIVRNFEANPNPIPMDYEHSIEFATKAPASGWVQQLEIRDDEDGRANLWAFCELTDVAAEHIRAGEYRYCSGVFDFDAHDLVTGEPIGATMDSLALVNTPFIRGQKPISLSRRAGARPEDDDMTIKKEQLIALMSISKESLAAALDQIEGDEITVEQLEAAAEFAAAKDGQTAEDEGGEGGPPAMGEESDGAALDDAGGAPPAPPAGAGAAMGEEGDGAAMADHDPEADAALSQLLEATGLPDMASLRAAIAENLDAVAAALTGALDQPAAPAPLSEAAQLKLSTAEGQVRALTAKVAEQQKVIDRFREEEADRLVRALADEGKILIGDADKWKRLCLSQRETFDALTATLPKVVPMGAHATATAGATGGEDEPPIDEDSEFVKRTRRNLARAGVTDKAKQDEAIRKGLRRLAENTTA